MTLKNIATMETARSQRNDTAISACFSFDNRVVANAIACARTSSDTVKRWHHLLALDMHQSPCCHAARSSCRSLLQHRRH